MTPEEGAPGARWSLQRGAVSGGGTVIAERCGRRKRTERRWRRAILGVGDLREFVRKELGLYRIDTNIVIRSIVY